MLRWKPAEWPGGRIVALSGRIEVGAIFSPFDGGKWRWRLFYGGSGAASFAVGVNGTAKTELAAKTALDAAWCEFLAAAGLREWSPV